MNAISFLIKEHNKVRRVLKKVSVVARRLATKQRLFDSLCHDLLLHETMEHELWYPHFKNNKNVKSLVRHLISEEKTAAKNMKKIGKVKSDEEWQNQFEQLKADIEHHAAQEEEDLFPNVQEILDKATLNEIGKEFREYKKQQTHEIL